MNPTLEKRKGGREEGDRKEEEDARREAAACCLGEKEREIGRGGEGFFNPNNSQPKSLNYP